uniref:Cytochrome b5 n=1 Tax=Xenopsylla cheopis TaxID=163159 RepID=A0A6M2DUD4_XENCH
MAAKQFTLAEIAKFNDNKKACIIIHNNVYDVTEFLNEHPGGEEVLLEQAGKDGSEAFEDVGHSSDARELMKKYKIGEIVEHERKKTQQKAQPDWSNQQAGEDKDNSLKTWILPIVLGILATILYRFYVLQ